MDRIANPRSRARRRRAQDDRKTLVSSGLMGLMVVLLAFAHNLESGGSAVAPDGIGTPEVEAPKELPGGGTSILPERRVVGFYGNPRNAALGILGDPNPVGTDNSEASGGDLETRLERARTAISVQRERMDEQVEAYSGTRRPVLRAFGLIATLATADPLEDGLYRIREDPEIIDYYLEEARRQDAILILDVQPGRANFLDEVKVLEPYLREPDVSLALDPEWRVSGDQVPGADLGSVDASEVNQVSKYLNDLVIAEDLPDKLLIIHQFTRSMITRRQSLHPRTRLEVVLDIDGVGTPERKTGTYDLMTEPPQRQGWAYGIKLFYEEDAAASRLMTPSQILALRPQPSVYLYE